MTRRAPGRRVAVACALVLALALALAASGCGSSQPTRRAAVRPAQDTTCPAKVSLRVVGRLHVGRGVGPLAIEGSTVWVARPRAGDVIRIAGAQRVARHLGGGPVSLALGFGKLWVALRDASRVAALDPTTLAVRDRTAVAVPVSVAAGGVGEWALSLDQSTLVEIDPNNGQVLQQLNSPETPASAMVPVGQELWVLGEGLSPLNAVLGRVVRAGFSLENRSLTGLSTNGKTIWLGEPGRRKLLRTEVRGAVTVAELPAPDHLAPVATAATRCGVWTADAHGELAYADPSTGAALAPAVHVGRSGAALVATTGGGVWVSDPVDGTVVHLVARPR